MKISTSRTWKEKRTQRKALRALCVSASLRESFCFFCSSCNLRRALALLFALLFLNLEAAPKAAPQTGWAQVEKILSQIVPPKFPARDFNLTAYGAVSDGKTDCTEAFKRAIAACREAGGGRAVVPAGTYRRSSMRMNKRTLRSRTAARLTAMPASRRGGRAKARRISAGKRAHRTARATLRDFFEYRELQIRGRGEGQCAQSLS